MLRLTVIRKPETEEVRDLSEAYGAILAGYQDDPKAAQELTGETAEKAPEFAAWTVIANVVLNLDEVINK